VLDAAAQAVEDWAREGANRAATRWNSWTAPVSAEPVSPPEPQKGVRTEPEDRATDEKGQTIVRRLTGWRKLLPRGDRD
jgi:hypothetical protein